MKPEKQEIEQSRDFRQDYPLAIYAKKQEKTFFMNYVEIYNIKNSTIEFPTPNIVTMLLNISNKAFRSASKKFKVSIEPNLKKNEIVKFEGVNLTNLYDYLEDVKVSAIFAYNAIEAFVNNSIPENYTYCEKNSKGITETWNKEAILKWMSTSDKLTKILPEIRSLSNPKSENFWSDFKNLERIRNEIIHPKQLSKELNVTNELHKEFFDDNILKYIKSAKDVLDFCCQGEFCERYFPVGFGSKKIKPIELDDFDEYFEEV